MLDWLRNLLFTPKRAEIMELLDAVQVLKRRVERLEGTIGIEKRKADNAAQAEALNAAIVDIAAKLQGGMKQEEVLKYAVATYPSLLLPIATKMGLLPKLI